MKCHHINGYIRLTAVMITAELFTIILLIGSYWDNMLVMSAIYVSNTGNTSWQKEQKKWQVKKFVVENAPQDAVVPDADDSDMVIEKIDEVMARIRMNCTKREWSERVKQKVSELVSLIGKVFVGDLLGDEYNQIQSLYKNATYMSTLNTRSFLAERNLTNVFLTI